MASRSKSCLGLGNTDLYANDGRPQDPDRVNGEAGGARISSGADQPSFPRSSIETETGRKGSPRHQHNRRVLSRRRLGLLPMDHCHSRWRRVRHRAWRRPASSDRFPPQPPPLVWPLARRPSMARLPSCRNSELGRTPGTDPDTRRWACGGEPNQPRRTFDPRWHATTPSQR